MAEQTINRQQVTRQQVLTVTYVLTVTSVFFWSFWAWRYGNSFGIILSLIASMGYVLSVNNDCDLRVVSKSIWAWSMCALALVSTFIFSPNFLPWSGVGSKTWLVNGRSGGAWMIAIPQFQHIEAVYDKSLIHAEVRFTTKDGFPLKVMLHVEYSVPSNSNQLRALSARYEHPDQELCDYFTQSITEALQSRGTAMTLDQLDSKLKIEQAIGAFHDPQLYGLGIRWGEQIVVSDVQCWRNGEPIPE